MLFVTIVCNTVLCFLNILFFLLLIRVVYSLFASEEGAAYSFLYACTEPIVQPVRNALDRSELFSSMPMDFSYIFSALILMLVRMILNVF